MMSKVQKVQKDNIMVMSTENIIYVCYFMSYSGDEFYLKSLTKTEEMNSAKSFCKKYIPFEYEAWNDEKFFKYRKFIVYEIPEGKTIKRNLYFGEYAIIDPKDIEEFDVATMNYFPKIYGSDGTEL